MRYESLPGKMSDVRLWEKTRPNHSVVVPAYVIEVPAVQALEPQRKLEPTAVPIVMATIVGCPAVQNASEEHPNMVVSNIVTEEKTHKDLF